MNTTHVVFFIVGQAMHTGNGELSIVKQNVLINTVEWIRKDALNVNVNVWSISWQCYCLSYSLPVSYWATIVHYTRQSCFLFILLANQWTFGPILSGVFSSTFKIVNQPGLDWKYSLKTCQCPTRCACIWTTITNCN